MAFTVNGKLLSYTAIEKVITQLCVTHDQVLSAKAQKEYGSNFDQMFVYCQTCDSAQVMMSKDSSIAWHYHQLCGELQQDEEGDYDEDF